MVAQVTPLTSDASRLADASPDGEVNCSEASGYETVPVMGGRTADEPADAKMWVHASWRPRRPLKRVRTRWARTERALEHLREEERGAVTAEYAIVIMAAVAFAGLLVAIMRSSEIRAMLVDLVENALGAAG